MHTISSVAFRKSKPLESLQNISSKFFSVFEFLFHSNEASFFIGNMNHTQKRRLLKITKTKSEAGNKLSEECYNVLEKTKKRKKCTFILIMKQTSRPRNISFNDQVITIRNER